MKKLSKIITAMILNILFCGIALAQSVPLDTSLISCAVDGMFDCKFKTGVIDSTEYNYEMEYKVKYSYNCPVDYYVAIRTRNSKEGSETNEKQLHWNWEQNATWPQTAIITGYGPLEFVDLKPKRTSNAQFTPPCEIIIHKDHVVDISKNTLKKV